MWTVHAAFRFGDFRTDEVDLTPALGVADDCHRVLPAAADRMSGVFGGHARRALPARQAWPPKQKRRGFPRRFTVAPS